jgi:DNA-binding CsgD family transcriptional regulator
VLQQIGMLERGVGGWSAALDILHQASAEAAQDPALQAEIEQQLALVTVQAGALPDAVPHLDLARSLATHASIDVLADIEVAELAHHVSSGGRPEPGTAERLVTLARAAIDSSRSDENSTMRVVVAASALKWLDDFDAARDLLDRLRAVLWEHKQDGLLVPVLFQLCELECWAGLTDRAKDLANLADQTRRRAALPGMRGMSSYGGALVAARTGRLVAAREAAARCLEGATTSGDVRNQIRALSLQGFIEVSDGRAHEGVGPLGRAWQLERRFGYGNPAVIRGAADHIEALLAADSREQAGACLRLLIGQAARTGNPWTISAARRSQGLVAASAGDLDSALSYLESAPGAGGVVNPLERGRTLLALAVVRRRCGRRAAAREAAERALAAFSSAKAQAWKWQAKDELRRDGGTVEVSRELTAAETEIAELTASGLSNKEIAATIHVSVKTVEAHLTHIYRKLEVHTRAQLTAHVNSTREAEPAWATPDPARSGELRGQSTGQARTTQRRMVPPRRP